MRKGQWNGEGAERYGGLVNQFVEGVMKAALNSF